jgi:putative inorganic carbon (HCO3(-)) transporter
LIEKFKLKWVYLISALFIAFNCYLITKELYWAVAIPLFALVAILFVFSLETVFFLAVFATPLSLTLNDLDLGFSVSMPGEPLMFGLLIMFIIKLFYDQRIDPKLLRHPVSILILIHLAWMLITSVTSELPVVSFKYLLSRLWFVIPFYFMAIVLFQKEKFSKRFIWSYTITLMIVIIYTTIRHSQVGFDEEIGHWVMDPFYNDHTAYGVITAMFLPVLIFFTFDTGQVKFSRIFAIVASSFVAIALYLSFSRAAWISLVFALGVLVIAILKIKFRWVFIISASLIGLFFAFQQQILDKLEKNKQDSSANFIEHVQSISNISSDASNLERINRWQAAIRLFETRPYMGWGPGTYQFVYAPYQLSKEKTIISTNAGDKGNAHSEYIGPLAEEGFPGTLIRIVLYSMVVFYGFKVYKEAAERRHRQLAMSLTLSMIAYFVHGIMNNFLDTDKASVPFWGFIAIIVCLDVYYPKRTSKQNKVEPAPVGTNTPDSL